jgi:hypothetical protein
MRYLKSYKLFESMDSKSIQINIHDILLELEDDDNFVISKNIRKENEKDFLEIAIKKNCKVSNIGNMTYPRYEYGERVIPGAPVPPGGKYKGNIFMWFEVKDVVVRLCKYYYCETDYTPGINSDIFNKFRKMSIEYKSNSPFRMFDGEDEFGIGWCEEEDFTLGDFATFTELKILIRL